ncbi:MAG: cation transporter [Candidatus Kapaibacterium sp.]|nr:MAG: cation transporter [Candidatus Kapabacteria bacterium]
MTSSNSHHASRDELVAMNLSLLTSLVMLVLKWSAYWVTQSAAAFSDALETIVHLAAVGFAAYSLRVVYRPPDSDHHFGHDKIAYFSSGIEGVLVVGAGIIIIFEAIEKWLRGIHLQELGVGILLLSVAALINTILGTYLLRKGRKKSSLILEANGKHILSDVWTSVGVVAGLGLAWWTGITAFDPIIAILFALYIIKEGGEMVHKASRGLMDASNPDLEHRARTVLEQFCTFEHLTFHRFRLRESGTCVYIDVHLQFPAEMSIDEAHKIASRAERVIAEALKQNADITTHLEPENDEEE